MPDKCLQVFFFWYLSIFTIFTDLLNGTFRVIYLLIQKHLFHSYHVMSYASHFLGMNGYPCYFLEAHSFPKEQNM